MDRAIDIQELEQWENKLQNYLNIYKENQFDILVKDYFEILIHEILQIGLMHIQHLNSLLHMQQYTTIVIDKFQY